MSKVKVFWKDMKKFLQEVWIEIRPHKGRVAWPSLDTVKLTTKVVIVSSMGVGLFIGFVDFVFGEVLKIIVTGGTG